MWSFESRPCQKPRETTAKKPARHVSGHHRCVSDRSGKSGKCAAHHHCANSQPLWTQPFAAFYPTKCRCNSGSHAKPARRKSRQSGQQSDHSQAVFSIKIEKGSFGQSRAGDLQGAASPSRKAGSGAPWPMPSNTRKGLRTTAPRPP